MLVSVRSRHVLRLEVLLQVVLDSGAVFGGSLLRVAPMLKHQLALLTNKFWRRGTVLSHIAAKILTRYLKGE